MPIVGVSASWWVLVEPIPIKVVIAVVLVAIGITLVNTKHKPTAAIVADTGY